MKKLLPLAISALLAAGSLALPAQLASSTKSLATDEVATPVREPAPPAPWMSGISATITPMGVISPLGVLVSPTGQVWTAPGVNCTGGLTPQGGCSQHGPNLLGPGLPPSLHLNRPVFMALPVYAPGTTEITGLWLIARDGGVFTVGNAPFYGSIPGIAQLGPYNSACAAWPLSGGGYAVAINTRQVFEFTPAGEWLTAVAPGQACNNPAFTALRYGWAWSQ